MQRSTTSRHSQEKNTQNSSAARPPHKSHKSTTSQRTAHSSNHSGSNVHVKPLEKPARPRLIDERNVDVTPKPMFEAETQIRTRHGSALFESIAGTVTVSWAKLSSLSSLFKQVVYKLCFTRLLFFFCYLKANWNFNVCFCNEHKRDFDSCPIFQCISRKVILFIEYVENF